MCAETLLPWTMETYELQYDVNKANVQSRMPAEKNWYGHHARECKAYRTSFPRFHHQFTMQVVLRSSM